MRGAVIWDPEVPASVNVATTIAGVEDGIVLSPEWADKYLDRWKLPVLADLRGRFTGAETGSRKNDAYRWAIREYLAKGRCSAHWLCLYEDAYADAGRGDLGYVVTRDWAVKNRAFVFDLSPWGDEVPQDDPTQPLGTDLQTYRLMLEEDLEAVGRQADDRVDRLLCLRQVQQRARTRQRPRSRADGVGNGLADLALQLLPEHGGQRLLQPVVPQRRRPGSGSRSSAARPRPRPKPTGRTSAS